MDARTYLEMIVAPTIAEAVAEPRDMRRCYVAAVVTFHLIDYLRTTLKSSGQSMPRSRVADAISSCNPLAFKLVHSVANAVKHSRPGHKHEDPIQFVPGTDQVRYPAFHGAGFMGSQIFGDRHGGRAVDLGSGGSMYLANAVLAFLECAQTAFSDEIGGVELPRAF